MMKSIMSVIYKGALANYCILRDKPGLYKATLIHYQGKKSEAPASEIILVRGIRQ